MTENGNTYLYCHDANGNVGRMVNALDGSVVAAYEYAPFGAIVHQSDGAVADDNPFRFSTKYQDNETGLYYYGYRYYSAEMGRWLNRDPAGEQAGYNLYVFVLNNPINGTDYLGMINVEACVELLKSIYVHAGKLLLELRKYNPVADGIGGFIHAHGTTVPGGHYQEIKNLQKGLKNRLSSFTKSCLSDDDSGGSGGSGGSGYPKWADQLANVKVPEPIYNNSTPTKSIYIELPDIPEMETYIVELKKYHRQETIEKTATGVAVVGGTAAGCYLIYRGARMLPSLVPVLWWTIPANAVAP
jgi:RHS repeat-associated protein